MMLAELSYQALAGSAVRAFPRTRRRQHATAPVEIQSLRFTPFLGMKTLLIRAVADNAEGGVYRPLVLVKGVRYADRPGRGLLRVDGEDGVAYHLDPGLAGNDVLVRCQCGDFFWRFHHYDRLRRSLYGTDRKPYRSAGGPPANPTESPGFCKHLFKLGEALRTRGLLL